MLLSCSPCGLIGALLLELELGAVVFVPFIIRWIAVWGDFGLLLYRNCHSRVFCEGWTLRKLLR